MIRIPRSLTEACFGNDCKKKRFFPAMNDPCSGCKDEVGSTEQLPLRMRAVALVVMLM